MAWQPSIGAWPEGGGVRFCVWTPTSQTAEVEILQAEGGSRFVPLLRADDGTFAAHVDSLGSGARYRYRLNGRDVFPDVASRYQPEGVHGPSEVVDARQFAWSDEAWPGIALRDVVVYELHVGTFTPQGSFDGVRQRLGELRDLGVTAIELMPIGDFPGERNWGYDGVSLYAPARCYGKPDDLRRLVDSAHQMGLAVFLDVVYNHLGPDGNYLGALSPYYFTGRHQTPWGQALNFDGEYSQRVRDFFIENALYWLHDFHFDGLRLDATHAIVDEGRRHFLAELADRVRESFAESRRHPLLIAEDSRNLALMMKPTTGEGWGMDGVWADDFHHQIRVAFARDRDGYFQDYRGSAEDIAETIRRGWFYCGQQSRFLNRARGSDPSGLAPEQFVVCIQNHDQVGNRAFGDRLHHEIDSAAYRAASTLLLCSPHTPLLFMGQEWAASTPFQFFTDHNDELGKLVTQGRRREFQRFKAFADPETREKIPDPQALGTFLNSRLRWDERENEQHAGTLRLYRDLLRLRRSEPAFGYRPPNGEAETTAGQQKSDACAFGDDSLLLRRFNPSAEAQGHDDVLIVVQLQGGGTIELSRASIAALKTGLVWKRLLSTEDSQYTASPGPITMEGEESAPRILFARAGAILLKATRISSAESQHR